MNNADLPLIYSIPIIIFGLCLLSFILYLCTKPWLIFSKKFKTNNKPEGKKYNISSMGLDANLPYWKYFGPQYGFNYVITNPAGIYISKPINGFWLKPLFIEWKDIKSISIEDKVFTKLKISTEIGNIYLHTNKDSCELIIAGKSALPTN